MINTPSPESTWPKGLAGENLDTQCNLKWPKIKPVYSLVWTVFNFDEERPLLKADAVNQEDCTSYRPQHVLS